MSDASKDLIRPETCLEMGLANDAARLQTASVRQDQRQYCVLVLRTHPVGSVVRILFRPETCLEMGLANATASLRTASVRQDHRKYCVLVLRTHPVGAVVLSNGMVPIHLISLTSIVQ